MAPARLPCPSPLVLLVPGRERIARWGDRVLAADLAVTALGDSLPAARVPEYGHDQLPDVSVLDSLPRGRRALRRSSAIAWRTCSH